MKKNANSLINYIIAGGAGGALAGALVGSAEGYSIFAADMAIAASTPVYGFFFYAVLLSLGGAGLGLALFLAVKLLNKDKWTARWAWAVSYVLILIPVALVVARFRIIRDVFHEKLAIASVEGIGVHVGLLVGAALLAWSSWVFVRPAGDKEESGSYLKRTVKNMGILFLGALVAFGTALFSSEEGEKDAGEVKAEGPPVILVMVDTMRADHLGPYGYEKAATPNLDKFAKDAVTFEQAFSNASWTRPSTASLLTSLPASGHKTMYKADRLPEGVETSGEAFKKLGYPTGGIVTNYNIAPYFNFNQGFDEYTYLSPEYYFWANEGSSKLSLHNVVRIIREKVAPSSDNPNFYYRDAEITTDAAISWLDRHKKNPFYLFMTYMDPHDPYFARPLSGESYSRAANTNPDPAMAKRFIELYDGEITYWDEHFGRLVEWLKKEGIYEEAMIVVTSDHGEEFQEHGGWWHGTTLYEEQIHVPLIVKLPKNLAAGERRKDLASLVDVAPSLIGAVKGSKPHESWSGRDLFGGSDEPASVFSEEDHQGNVLRSIRGQEWKLIEANEGNPRGLAPVELYRIDKDPDEKRNEAAKIPEKTKSLQAELEKASQGVIDTIKRDQMEVDEESQELLRKLGYAEEDDTKDKKKESDKDNAKSGTDEKKENQK